MIDLDDDARLRRLDSEDVLGAVERFAEQCREAWEIGSAATGLPSGDGVENIVVLGMGGSGVAGDVTQSVVEPRLPIPFRTIKSYGPIPEWVGRNTLAFAVSYSGSTEETIAALEGVNERAARVVTISAGGPLAEMASSLGLAHVQIPSGLQPRASLGYLTMPILAVLARMGLVPDLQPDVDEAIKVLSEIAARGARDRPVGDNPAKDLARSIVDRIPVISGGYGLGATAAYRFKCDLNEYGKVPAFWHYLPELDHNEIVGWNKLKDLTRKRFVAILLRDSGDGDRIDLRFELTRKLTKGHFADVIELHSEGASELARILSLILITQLAAIYVGLANGVDPGPVEVIQKLKAELRDK